MIRRKKDIQLMDLQKRMNDVLVEIYPEMTFRDGTKKHRFEMLMKKFEPLVDELKDISDLLTKN